MCIAILNRTGLLSKKAFNECWNNNPDGGGFAYFDGNKIVIQKEMKSKKSFYKAYSEHRAKYPDIDFAIHFRIATHGKVNETNCHPFSINKLAAFIHNGIIQATGSAMSEYSDTYNFNELIIKKLPGAWHKNPAILELISNYIGHSKLVFIIKNETIILNEELGQWDGGNWFSNGSYKPITKVSNLPVFGKYANNGMDLWDGLVNYNPSKNAFSDDICEDRNWYECEACGELANDIEYEREFNVDICGKCRKAYGICSSLTDKFYGA